MIFIVACVFATEYKVSESKETKISKIKEEGYEIIVPKGLFEGVNLKSQRTEKIIFL